jgi:hypothetical protein
MYAQEVPWADGRSESNHLLIKLATIDPGDELTSWWGHTAIIVEDTVLKRSRFYNFGLFSFEQDNFILNFIQGRLIFWVGDWDTGRALSYYRSLDRTIRIQQLNLSPRKRLEMAQYLAENVRPENREYLYDHYLDNCATRVRDLIDLITEGSFASAMKVEGKMTFREHTRRHTARNIFVDWILMFLMHDGIDKSILRWDEMFLPTELEDAVADFVYSSESGQKVPLVKHSFEFYTSKDRDPVPDSPAVHVWWALSACLMLAFIFYFILEKYGKNKSILAAAILFLGIVFGVPGFILFFFSLFTDHTVTYGNENIFFANPLTFLLIFLGIGLIFKKYPFYKWIRINVFAVTLLAWIGLILKVIPLFDQNNWLTISTILPFLTSFSLFWIIQTRNND